MVDRKTEILKNKSYSLIQGDYLSMFENVEYAREYGQSAAKRINLSGKPGKPSPKHLPLEVMRDQVR